MRGLRGEAAIAGVAEFAPTRKPEKLWMGLEAYSELARMALDDAGLSISDVDAVLTGNNLQEAQMFVPATIIEYLGVESHFSEVVDLGGASGAALVLRAAMAIEMGLCETALCMLYTQAHHRNPKAPPVNYARDWGGGVWGSPQAEFEIPFGAVQGTYGYAMIANRYAHEFGLTDEQRAKVAVDQRTNALAHPHAVFRNTPITTEDVLNSPMICSPLHMLEIVMPCMGGAAVVVTSKEKAAKTKNRPVYVVGGGENTTHRSVTYEPDFTHSPIKAASDRAWAMSGLKPKDIDLASVYDCYTITVLLTLEDTGFCGKGEAGRFVMEHDLTYKGDFPMNTHGGQLSFGQAGIAGGMSHVTEAVLQLQGRAGDRQLRKCDTAFVNGNGGIMSEQVSIILRGVTMTTYRPNPSPIPNPIPTSAPFWAGTKEHKLMLQRCPRGHVFYYARTHCPQCLSKELEWFEASGRGTLYSFTICERAQSADFEPDVPYVVAAIALAEGPRMTSLLVDTPHDQVRCDMPVEVVWQDVGDEAAMPYFRGV